MRKRKLINRRILEAYLQYQEQQTETRFGMLLLGYWTRQKATKWRAQWIEDLKVHARMTWFWRLRMHMTWAVRPYINTDNINYAFILHKYWNYRISLIMTIEARKKEKEKEKTIFRATHHTDKWIIRVRLGEIKNSWFGNNWGINWKWFGIIHTRNLNSAKEPKRKKNVLEKN